MEKDEVVQDMCIDGPHNFRFKESVERDGFSERVDIFYCTKCLKYAEKVVWRRPRRF